MTPSIFYIILFFGLQLITTTTAAAEQLKFRQSLYKFSLNENNQPNQLVGQVSVNLNSKPLKFSMYVESGDKFSENFFNIEQSTGKIFANKVFDIDDYKINDVYEYVVNCEEKEDLGKAQKPAKVVISIKNLNDNHPIFPGTEEENYTFQLEEHQPHGTYVGQVEAFDKDRSFKELEYSLTLPRAKLVASNNKNNNKNTANNNNAKTRSQQHRYEDKQKA